MTVLNYVQISTNIPLLLIIEHQKILIHQYNTWEFQKYKSILFRKVTHNSFCPLKEWD